MAIQAPLIDPRSYDQLVEDIEELVEQETAGAAEPRADRLTGAVLAEDVFEPGSPPTLVARRGSLIDAELAKRIEDLAIGPVEVQGWQPRPATLAVPATAADLTGAVLAEDIYDPSGSLRASRGTLVEAPLAEEIERIDGLGPMEIELRNDAVWALIRIFARMAELAIEQINRIPEKSFLAFLDLIGTRLEPPQPARAPVTFLLAKGSSTDALVPAGTRVAATPEEGEEEPVVFETERELWVTRSRLTAACIREPGSDRWRDVTAIATGETRDKFKVFRGAAAVEHLLYLGCDRLLDLPSPMTITLSFTGPGTLDWLDAVSWGYWEGTGWQPPLKATISLDDGTVTLVLPETPALAATEVNGKTSAWLRGSLNTPLPRGELEKVGDEQELPQIDTVKVKVQAKVAPEADLLPDLGLSNQVPVDLSKDFFPFGEKPKVGDACYLASEAAFGLGGAKITLTFSLSAGWTVTPSDDLVLVWETWDTQADQWTLLGRTGPNGSMSEGFTDSTNALTTGEKLTFRCPETAGATDRVDGEARHWIRVRIEQGNYGREAHYELATEPDAEPLLYRQVAAGFGPPSVSSIRLSYEYPDPDLSSQPEDPDHLVTENDFEVEPRTPGEPFTPFVPMADTRPTLYLGFERPGEDVGFANRATSLYFGLAEARPGRAAEDRTVPERPRLSWQYWDGDAQDWRRLSTRDETRGMTRRGLVTFVGPANLGRSSQFNRTAFWLRVRWERGGYVVEPELARVLTGTTWAVHGQTVTGEVLGSSNGEPGQAFTTSRSPVLAGQRLVVREREMPSLEERKAIEQEEGGDAIAPVAEGDGESKERWVRWHEVPDFYGSGPRSRHYTLDRLSGELRFGDGRRGLVPPTGRGNVRMSRYRTGGGRVGNRPAASLIQLKGAVPYIDGVTNTEPAAGGADQESLAEVRIRGPKALRHRQRAVAVADFEDLAFQASRDVARAKAGEGGLGSVVLVVVPRRDEARPGPDLALLEQVKDFIEARMTPTASLQVVGPDWLRVKLAVEVVPVQPEQATEVRDAVHERLAAFLHPLTGGPEKEGWAFGRKPEESDLYALVAAAPGVDHVRRLTIEETPVDGEARAERFLVYSGEHEVEIAGGGNGTGGKPA